MPAATSARAFCPLPLMPATPTISPRRTSSPTRSSALTPRPSTVADSSFSTTSPGVPARLAPCCAAASEPIIRTLICSASSPATSRSATTLPWRRIVTSSAIAMTSRSRCVMKMIDLPPPASFRIDSNSSAAWGGLSTAVGSSRIRMSRPRYSSLRIASCCNSPTLSDQAGARGSSPKPAAAACAATSCSTFRPPHESVPRTTFSVTVNRGTSLKSWCTTPMPAASAARGEPGASGRPRTATVPESGKYCPHRTEIRVVFPAPFSPSRARISPAFRVRSTWSLARRSPNDLVIPLTSRTVAAGSEAAPSSGAAFALARFVST